MKDVDENKMTSPPIPDLNPPIITHTAATPMPTPQGSPNDHGAKEKECNKVTLCVHPQLKKSTLSVRSGSSVSFAHVQHQKNDKIYLKSYVLS